MGWIVERDRDGRREWLHTADGRVSVWSVYRNAAYRFPTRAAALAATVERRADEDDDT